MRVAVGELGLWVPEGWAARAVPGTEIVDLERHWPDGRTVRAQLVVAERDVPEDERLPDAVPRRPNLLAGASFRVLGCPLTLLMAGRDEDFGGPTDAKLPDMAGLMWTTDRTLYGFFVSYVDDHWQTAPDELRTAIHHLLAAIEREPPRG